MRQLSAALALLVLVLAGCNEGAEEPEPVSRPSSSASDGVAGPADLAGSRSCRECHERFYELWAPSHHGTAMQPYTAAVGRRLAGGAEGPVTVGERAYRFVAEGDEGFVVGTGTGGETRHPVAHVMGGKNVFFLLTPLERGRLQVLPIAYDVRRQTWYDTTASMLRHAGGHPDEAVEWTDPLLTFNTACWSCHVSQLSLNYDEATDSYSSVWAEPGINCETCHGSAVEHVRRFRAAAAAGEAPPEELGLTSVKAFTPQQRNDACNTCHAKSSVLTSSYAPGDAFFDHFDLICLENADYYPDGRDLGENYTMTSWRMSACATKGNLDCIHCHTSSGRYRFAEENPNGACLPCHEAHVSDVAAHSHHPAGSPGSRCVDCHMPMTEFARMRRTDHSMRPPAPAATMAYGSPNACTICHADEDAAWADGHVRAWRTRDYQAPILAQAALVNAAREGDWRELEAMLAAIEGPGRDEIVATSLIRLLAVCPDPRVGPALRAALADSSPLVRSAAAEGLQHHPSREMLVALVGALGDPVRLVRVRAARALAGVPPGDLPPEQRAHYERAMGELEVALAGRPDTWSSHYNVGNLREQQGDLPGALAAYRKAAALRPDVIQPLVNAALVLARLGRTAEAEKELRQALVLQPGSAAAHYNLGLLLAELDRKEEAKEHLTRAYEADPSWAGAAYNLAVLHGLEDVEAAITWSQRAYEARKDDARYAHTHAYFLREAGRVPRAVEVLEQALQAGVVAPVIIQLLGEIYEAQGREDRARVLYTHAAIDPRLPQDARRYFRSLATGR